MRNFSEIVAWYSADRIGRMLAWNSNVLMIIYIVNGKIAFVHETELLNWTEKEESLQRVGRFFSWSRFVVSAVIGDCLCKVSETKGAFHLLKISGISGSAVNGTRFVDSSHWKILRKSGKSKKVVPFSRLEFRNGISCSIYVSRSLYQFQVHSRAPPRTGVYDQMEQLFTNRKFHFCYHRNFRVFFLNGKRPKCHVVIRPSCYFHRQV